MKTSVAMCTYNGEKFLREQLDSILTQTLPVDEIIICDDGSTDNTVSILHEYEKKHTSVIKIYQNEKNLRSVKNFEKSISLCTNEIIFLSDQDDEWLPHKVETISLFFKNNPKIDAVATNGYGIDEKGTPLNMLSIWDIPYHLENKGFQIDYFRMIAFSGNIATGASMAFRKNIVPEVSPFPEIRGFHHDEWIALYTSASKTFTFLNEKFFKYRIHPGQQVGDTFYNEKQFEQLLDTYNDLSSDKTFRMYKHAIKKLCAFSSKNKILAKNEKYNTIHSQIMEEVYSLHHKNITEMKKKYPFRSRMLFLADKIVNKRQMK